jgi:F0F1-type ATP synthase delta subunit
MEELEARCAEFSFYKQLHVTSADNLDGKDIAELQAGFDVASSRTKQRTDPNLLAGVSCEYSGIQIKDNLQGRLQALQNRLYIN